MDLIFGERGSGRTLRCFNYARKNNAIIISNNARALRVKAKALGFDDVKILAPEELNGNYANHNALLHKWDKDIKEQWQYNEGVNITAISFDEECAVDNGDVNG